MNATAAAPRLRDLWNELEDDQAVAASCHADTPNKIIDLRGGAGHRRLKRKKVNS